MVCHVLNKDCHMPPSPKFDFISLNEVLGEAKLFVAGKCWLDIRAATREPVEPENFS